MFPLFEYFVVSFNKKIEMIQRDRNDTKHFCINVHTITNECLLEHRNIYTVE